ncbi:1-acyl-sn-glycerol-3-phosphate acyltransferase [Nocardioides piscis]|uniref:Acyl-phosphate glycerol 3-phosphate acyltransferase n=1 Tax=Nocardioides piscis TaxID=2714938 RepID=A0A6G7YJ61_9ACTN|nr:1-acyl-sn-glycerol-3-phosphate acyltransferase [Nocardioides piscis]QIK76775.1 acyl-phosphate glycerol 3-phosphate acyltransferase [Nocardioides piscis]
MSRMVVRPLLARTILRAARWRTEGTLPPRGIVVGAPHTSNWDWVFSLLLAWSQGRHPRIMVKKEFFSGPVAPIMRATGAISVDRKNPAADLRKLIASIEGSDDFLLAIAAEGTRSKSDHWKSGFYRLAQQTGLPITLAFIDGPSRTVGAGPTITPSGDLAADMDLVRAFYADKRGIHPEQRTEPRLRNEA